MKQVLVCDQCHGELPEDAPEGLCPRCLLALGGSQIGLSVRRLNRSEPASEAEGAHTRFGNYEILEKIGQGGMGAVYKARQVNLDRIVALKLLPFGAFSRSDLVQRFRSEASSAAALQHPNIVAVHDVGEQDGQPFFSMDFVEGRTLAEVVRDQPLPARRAAAYVQTIAQAVHYAHERGILHRDLKPSNVLIDSFEQPRITDFGLAKRLTGDSDLTLTGQVLGSPNFISPEQAEGRSEVLGPASDIYSLGALLYHLLTRQPPFQADTLTTLLKQVIETEPVAPRLLNPSIPRDLETICLKCLEKEPARRYRSAKALAEDLGRFLADQPVVARPVGMAGKTWRWCRRQPVRAGLIAAVVVLFLAGTSGVLWQWREARNNARAEARQRQASEKATYAANLGLVQALINENRFDRARELLTGTPEKYRGWEWGWLQRQCSQDFLTLKPKERAIQVSAVFSPDMRLLATCGFGFKPDIHLWDLQTGREVRRLIGHKGNVSHSEFSPDGRQFASAGWGDGTAKIWRVETGELLWTLPHDDAVFCVSYSPDGTRLVTACHDGKARIWDARTGKFTGLSADYGDRVAFARFGPDGRWVAFCGGFFYWADALDTSVRVWDLESGRVRRLESGHQGTVKVVWSPKGDLLVSSGWDGVVRLWEWPSGRELPQLEQTGRLVTLNLDFSPDGRYLAVAGANLQGAADPMGRIFEVQTRKMVRELAGHGETLVGIRFSPDSRFIASASGDYTVKVWPVQALPPFLGLEGHNQAVWTVAFSPDRKSLATGSFDGTAKLWDSRTGRLLQDFAAGAPVISLAFSPKGDCLVTPGVDNAASLWEVKTGTNLMSLRGHTGAVMAVAWSRDNRFIATGGKDNTARLWNAENGREAARFTGHTGWVVAVAFAPDGKLLATASLDHTIRLWDIKTGSCWQSLASPSTSVVCLAFSPQGNLLASGSQGAAYLWDLRTGRNVGLPLLHRPIHVVTALSFSPDGQRLATAENSLELYANNGRELRVHLWDVESGHELYSFAAHTNAVYAVAFGPDGTSLATGGCDNTARIWTAFPWRLADYPGGPGVALTNGLEEYKREFWRVVSTNFLIAELNKQQQVPARRLVRHPLGDLNLPPPGSKTKPLLPIPARAAEVSSNQVDLTPFYNVALNESWQPVRFMPAVDFNLAAIPQGLRTFAGIDFDVRGLIQLRAASPDFELFPVSVVIPLKRKCQGIHLLHGARWDVETGTPIAQVVVNYADGLQTEFPVRYGKEVERAFAEDLLEGSRRPWGKEVRPAASDWNVHLHQTTFANPHPERAVASIEYVSKLVRCAPFLVALTVDGGP